MLPLRRILAGLALTLVSTVTLAQAYPTRPIRVIVPFPPGGGTDIIAREVTAKIATNTGWVLVVENKPGAGGNLGVDAAAKATPDGYTLVLGQTSNLAINPTLYRKLPYDPVKDLAPISLVASAPLVFVTSGTSQFKTLKDVVAAARGNPDKINFASPGSGTVAHLVGELFQQTAGVKFQHVPYKGVSQAVIDLIGGSVELYSSSVPSALGFIRQGKMRALAVTSAKRIADLPDVPTVGELGYKDCEAVTWFGLAAPAGTPREVIARLNTEVNKALQDPALKKKLETEGADPGGSTAEQFASLIKDEIVRWGKIVKASGAKVD